MKGGNPKRKCKKNQKKCKASMRPPFMKGGNAVVYGIDDDLGVASMRPPFMKGGNRHVRGPCHVDEVCFNEAALHEGRK